MTAELAAGKRDKEKGGQCCQSSSKHHKAVIPSADRHVEAFNQSAVIFFFP